MTGQTMFPRFAAVAFTALGLALLALPADAATKKRKPAQPAPATPTEPARPTVADDGAHDRQTLKDVRQEPAADGSLTFWFAGGDKFSGEESPDITAHGLDIEAQFVYDPKADENGILISQGDPQEGWTIHFINGKPAVTLHYDGLNTTLSAEEALPQGHVILRVLLGLDGTLALHATGLKAAVRGHAPMTGGFPRRPSAGLEVGQSVGPLKHRDIASNAPNAPENNFVRLSLLPSMPVGTPKK